MGAEGKNTKRGVFFDILPAQVPVHLQMTPLMFPLTDDAAQEDENQGAPISQITEFLSVPLRTAKTEKSTGKEKIK